MRARKIADEVGVEKSDTEVTSRNRSLPPLLPRLSGKPFLRRRGGETQSALLLYRVAKEETREDRRRFIVRCVTFVRPLVYSGNAADSGDRAKRCDSNPAKR